MASLSGTFVYMLFTSKEMILSSEFSLVFSIITLAASLLISIFAPSILTKKLQYFIQFLIRTTEEREVVVVVYILMYISQFSMCRLTSFFLMMASCSLFNFFFKFLNNELLKLSCFSVCCDSFNLPVFLHMSVFS